MQRKSSTRNKLVSLLCEVNAMKKQMAQLYSSYRQFTFASIVPKKMIQQFLSSKKRGEQNCGSDKQNNPVYINENVVKKFENKSHAKLSETKPIINRSSKQSFENVDDCQIQTKNQEMKDIKANLIQQLSELKSIQRKQQLMRRTNERMKEYNSQQKKYYRESISKQKLDTTLTDSGASEKTLNINPYSSKVNSNCLESSQISISIPISIQAMPKTLKCQNGHEFYEGMVNVRNQPHGNGRLKICCSSMPWQIGGNTMKDAQFYQGQFKDGKFNGFGTLSYRGGVKYVGQFREGRRQGKGSLYYNGKAEIAKWQNDVFVSIM